MTARVSGIVVPGVKVGSPSGIVMSMCETPSGLTEIEIVIDELAPRIHHTREALGIS